MFKKLFCIIIFLFLIFPVADSANLKTDSDNSDLVIRSINKAWDVSWNRFYISKTHLFYDYLISYKKGQYLSQLPRAEEVSRLYPNPYGYGTGMEDCMISAGIMMCMIVDRYAVTGEPKLRKYAYDVFQGIRNCTTVHGVPGFVARGICPYDQKSVYIASSRDQVTHAVHGLWYYYNSPLCDDATKVEIGTLLSSIADRMKKNVIPENDYDFLMADGSRDPRGISRMWHVAGHEVARLPMIYAAAWNATGKQEYYELYRKYIKEAVSESFKVAANTTTYALLQMQSSFELLKSLEKNPELIEQMNEIMAIVSKLVYSRAINAEKNATLLDLTALTSDWRNGVGIANGSEYRKIWYCVRESGEAALSLLTDPNNDFTNEQKSLLAKAITRLDYNQVSTSGIFYLQGAYWKARRLNITGI